MEKCPKCGQEMVAWCGVPGCHDRVDVYSRPCGYLRPTTTWNDGKQQEFKERSEYETWANDIIARKSAHKEMSTDYT